MMDCLLEHHYVTFPNGSDVKLNHFVKWKNKFNIKLIFRIKLCIISPIRHNANRLCLNAELSGLCGGGLGWGGEPLLRSHQVPKLLKSHTHGKTS